MRTSKWSIFESGSNRSQWSIGGKRVGRKSTKRNTARKTQWSIGGQSTRQTQWSIGS